MAIAGPLFCLRCLTKTRCNMLKDTGENLSGQGDRYSAYAETV